MSTNKPMFVSFKELMERPDPEGWRLCKIQIEGSSIRILYGPEKNMVYEVELNRMDNGEKLAGWLHHLTEKNWIGKGDLRRLAEVVSEECGFNIYGH